MRIFHEMTLDRAGALESNARVGPVGTDRRFCERQHSGVTRPPQAEGAFGRVSKIAGLMRCVGGVLILAALGVSGQRCTAGGSVPSATNRVILTWGSLGPGTQYYVQTSTNLLVWTAATNTVTTNAVLTFTGDKSRTFRLWASNAPPQSATLAWNPGVPSTDVAGYFIYYGVSTRSYTNRLDAELGTNGTVSNLVAGTTYYFAATAYTTSGLESDFSDEVVWQRPLWLRIQRLP